MFRLELREMLIIDVFNVTVQCKPPTNTSNKVITFLKLFFLGLLVHLIFTILKAVFIKFDLLAVYNHPTSTFLQEHVNDQQKVLYAFFLTVVIHPLIEELSFRLLLDTNRLKISMGVGFMISFVILLVTKIHVTLSLINSELSFVILFTLIGLLIGLTISKLKLFIKISSDRWGLSYVTFTSAVVFSLVHFNVVGFENYLSIVKIIPFFFVGYLLAYIKLRYGFWLAWFFHSFNNLFFFLSNFFMASHFSG